MIPNTVTAEIAAADKIILLFRSLFFSTFILDTRSLTSTFFDELFSGISCISATSNTTLLCQNKNSLEVQIGLTNRYRPLK